MRRSLILLAVTLFLIASTLPSAAAEPPVTASLGSTSSVERGQFVGDSGIITPDCDDPPCEVIEMVSAGSGGLIPIEPIRVAELTALGTTTTRIDIAGVGAMPTEGVGAVVLNLEVTNARRRSSVTVWPTGTPRPNEANLAVDRTRTWTTVAVVRPGDDGQISVRNDRGRIDLNVDVLGWFPADSELLLVDRQRVLDTSRRRPGHIDRSGHMDRRGHMGRQGHKLGPDTTIDVVIAGKAGIPTDGVAAVVINLTSFRSSSSSGVVAWPSGEPQPGTYQLITEPGRTRSNIAVVPLGEDGAISIGSERGRTHVAVDVLGWMPIDSAYRPVTPGTVFDSETGGGTTLGTGETIAIQIEGLAGVPDVGSDADLGSPHAVVLNLTSDEPSRNTALTVYPTGDERPTTISLAAGWHKRATVALAIVQLGEDGMVSVYNAGAPADFRVEVVGWFANPTTSVELALPESTVAPDGETVESFNDGSIVLTPEAEPIEPGDHVVLGVTADTPEGYLGTVTSVITEADGAQRVETTEAYLEDVFPEGDLTFDIDPQDYDIVEFTATNLANGKLAISGTGTTADGLKMDVTILGAGDADACELSGIETYLRPIFGLQMSLKWRFLRSPLLTALATVGAEAGMSLEKVSAQCGWELDLFKTVVVVVVGVVPVVLVYEGSLGLDVDAGLVGLDLGASVSAGVTIGVLRNRFPYMTGFAEFDYTTIDEAALQARDLKAYAMLDLWLNVEVRLYGIVGPRISMGPFLETFLTTNPSEPWWAVDLGLAAKVGLLVKLWFKTWNFGVWEGEIPIAKWVGIPLCSPYGPGIGGSYEGVCRTPVPVKRANGDVRDFAGRFRVMSAGRPLAQLAIVPMTLPPGLVDEPYNSGQPLQATGMFSNSVVWRVVDGQIPGITLDSATGVFSGTPTMPGTFTTTVEAWYGPVPDGATEPPYGPLPPPQIELTLTVDGGCGPPIMVTDAADDGSDGQLRHAIDVVCDGGTVSVPSGMNIVLTQGELVVPAGKTITVYGNHSGETQATIDGNGIGRVLRVERGASVTLIDVGITGGNAASGGGVHVLPSARLVLGGQTAIYSNTATEGGGVILESDPNAVNPTTLEMYDSSRIEFNTATYGGGVRSFYSTISITDSSAIADNVSDDNGGGIAAHAGSFTMEGSSSVSNNTAAGSGGAIATQGGTTITLDDDSRMIGNEATDFFGGAIYMGGPIVGSGDDSLVLNGNARIEGNRSGRNGGAVSVHGPVTLNNNSSISSNTAGADGGAFFIWEGDVTLNDTSSLSGNLTAQNGGGIAIIWAGEAVTVTLNGASTISGNTAELNGGGIYRPAGTVVLNDTSAVYNNHPNDIHPPL